MMTKLPGSVWRAGGLNETRFLEQPKNDADRERPLEAMRETDGEAPTHSLPANKQTNKRTAINSRDKRIRPLSRSHGRVQDGRTPTASEVKRTHNKLLSLHLVVSDEPALRCERHDLRSR